jgi:hypothetical protein
MVSARRGTSSGPVHYRQARAFFGSRHFLVADRLSRAMNKESRPRRRRTGPKKKFFIKLASHDLLG